MEVLATVGGAILSSSLEMLIKKLGSEFPKFAGQEEVCTELMKWKRKLLKIRKVLDDAEEKQMTDQHVETWVGELRDLAYDVEDLLDEFETEALRLKLEAEPQASTSKIRKLIPTCCTGLNPSAFKFNVEMESKIKGIAARLEDITKEKDDLNLRETDGRRSSGAGYNRNTSSLLEANVYSREKEKEEIVKLLLSGEASDAHVSVIPIQGMGGIGKTTLAQLVYNDSRVQSSFDLKIWVCVSEYFDISQITKTILQSGSGDADDLNSLQEKLKQKLTGKKFLIILDDVWNEDYLKWDNFRRPLEAGAPGSRIIVTTRNQRVSSAMGTVPAYPLKELPNDGCLSLFAQHALGARNFDAHPNLKDIGEQMVQKCKGLPLAAKALGGLLRSERDRAKWEDVLRSKIWNEETSGILPALRLSYYHLPSHLKRCFVYCAMFPKDYEFDKDKLTLLWMAEGFLQQPKETKRMEDIGLAYFHDLLSRSFFQQSSSNKSRFVMHDLINDLARSVFGGICVNYEDNLQGNKQCMSFEKVRYLSFTQEYYDLSRRFDIFCKMKSLRTLLALPRDFGGCYLSNKLLHDLLPQLECLRVLSLGSYYIKELPDSIGNLKHLRQLNLSHSEIQCLPKSVGALYNLQTLILYGCNRLTKLPSSIGNLINLYHLDLSHTNSLQEMPLEIVQLTNLHKLTKFIVGKGDELGIRELKKLPHLCGQLSILGLHNVVDIRGAKDANLKNKHGLEELVLEWIDDFNDSRNERDDEVKVLVLDSLQPNKDLKKLSIAFYGGTRFPSWFDGSCFTNIVKFSLRGCRKCKSLPSLGQLPLLKVLYIQGMNAVKCVGPEFLGHCSPPNKPFESLETLKLKDMIEWEDWSWAEETSIKGFPNLKELEISNCPKLVGKLPSHLPSLIKLVIFSCPLLENLPLNLPSLREMSVHQCNEMVHKSMVDLSSLTTLKINRIAGLSCLDQGLMNLLVAIKFLEIEDCKELKCLWRHEAELEKLTSLKITNCPQLVSLASEDQDLHSLKSLKSFKVKDCGALETLPDWVMRGSNNNPCLLEELVIKNCPSFKSFPRGKLPTTLKSLKIRECKNLESLPEGMMHNDNEGNNTSQLEQLSISGCSSLTSFPVDMFPATLQSLEIRDCMQLESPLERMPQNSTTRGDKSLPPLQCLTRLKICGCSALESFPEMGLSIPNLKSFKIYNCVNLKSLPDQMHNLTSLQDLGIRNCPGIVSFPDGGLPPNLEGLLIESCENLKQPMMEWGLHTLSSLRRFTLGNTCPPDIVSFPDDECLILPTALTWIHIANRNNLESISKGIQNLTSLEFVFIRDCPKLRSLPKEGLPASLGYLTIRNCPLLKEGCLKDKGEYWSILTDIPYLRLN